MSTCYPNPGSVEISDGETLVLVSNYSREQRHTGVMGLFYILVTDASPKSDSLLVSPVEVRFFYSFDKFMWSNVKNKGTFGTVPYPCWTHFRYESWEHTFSCRRRSQNTS